MIAKARFGVNPAIEKLRRGGGPIIDDLRRSLQSAADFWHKNLLKQHFEPGARRKYPGEYTRRTNGYIRRKAREGKQPGPNRYTGAMRETLLRGRLRKANAKGAKTLRVRAELPYAPAVNFWSGKRTTNGGETHNIPRELRAMNKKDVIAIERVIQQDMSKRLPQALIRAGRRIPMKKV